MDDSQSLQLLRGLLDHAAGLLRAFYLAASALILLIQAVPLLRRRFLAYGSREKQPPPAAPGPVAAEKPSSPIDALLDYLATLRVPHRYFSHFYLVSVLSSLFWAWTRPVSSMSLGVQTAWLLMLVQGVRRMLESFAFMSTSTNQMWFGHWVLGLLFYLTVNVAIWIEEPHALSAAPPASAKRELYLSWRVALLAPAILVCQALQHSYHAYLYRLRTGKGYQVPRHPLFPNLLCPHYSCEIAIYLLLAFLAVPGGGSVNLTLLSAAVMVAVNLAVTASGTKAWYEQHFGEKVCERRRIVPWLW